MFPDSFVRIDEAKLGAEWRHKKRIILRFSFEMNYRLDRIR